jgi:hypothetical protein
MDLDLLQTLQRFFFWCMVINAGIYTFTAIAVFVFRRPMCWIHEKIFGFDEETTMRSVHKYLANYKLLITAFNFVPWVAILVIK